MLATILQRQGGETHWEEDMTSSRRCEGENYTPPAPTNPPTDRNQRGAQNDHPRNQNPRNAQRKPILLQNLRHFLEEVTPLYLLDGCTPSDVIRKHMGKNGGAQWDRQTAKEEKKEWNPLDVLKRGPEEFLVSQSVFQKSEPKRAGSKEYYGGGEPDLETVHVEVVHGKLESEKDVVKNADRDRSSDAVCRTQERSKREGKNRKEVELTIREHICQDRELVMERRTTPYEPMDGGVNGTLGQPLGERIEQQLGTPVRILLPSVHLVVDRKRDSLLKFSLGVRGPPDDVTLLLQSHGHVEILRDVML